MKRLLTTGFIVVASLLFIGAVFFASSSSKETVSAVSGSDFNPGRIIDDSIFYDATAMTSTQIRAFLNSKVPNCDTNGTGMATEWGRPDITRATLASYFRNGTHGYNKDTGFHAPPYTCLRDYEQDTPQMEAASGLCNSLSAKEDQSAVQIIRAVAAACGINPQVLIVLLEKEQSLVTDIWPLKRQFASATGFDCPDSAPCDPAYAGLFYQIYYAARQFKVYQKYPNDFNYIAGRTNRIYWHPDLSRCGSSQVYIENQATAALYIYTPYRPNQAALNNLYGTGNSCSSYGNRNFWRIFNDWFGSTLDTLPFTTMSTPRYLRLTEDMAKTNLRTGEPDGVVLSKGTEIYFTTRYEYEGELYVRTQSDSKNRLDRGIRYADLVEIIPFESINKSRYLRLTEDMAKTNLRTGEPDGVVLSKGTEIYFTSRYIYNGELYVRTKADTNRGLERGIRYADLEEILHYDAMENPRYLRLTKDVAKTNLRTGEPDGMVLSKGQKIYFTTRYEYNGKLYVRTQVDTEKGLDRGIRYADLENIR